MQRGLLPIPTYLVPAAMGRHSPLSPLSVATRCAHLTAVCLALRLVSRETTTIRLRPRLGATCKDRAEALAAGTFTPLGIETTADVVRERLKAVIVAAEMLRGPAGSGEFLCNGCEKALARAAEYAESRLPAALRGQHTVEGALGLVVAALQSAGSATSQANFEALETPLLSVHGTANPEVRKAVHSRLVGVAQKLLDKRCPEETRPLGTTLQFLAAAVRGPATAPKRKASGTKWKAPEVLQIGSESRSRLPAARREAVLHRDNSICRYCGRVGSTTVDHWLPLCRGGTNDMVNLVCACQDCNELKGNAMPSDFPALTPASAADAEPR